MEHEDGPAADTPDVRGLLNPAELRRAYGRHPSGVAAVCAVEDEGTPVGIAASSFVGVSLDPPLISVCVQRSSTTWPRLVALSRLGVSVLSEDHDHLGRQLGSRTEDRFAGVDTVTTEAGALFIAGAALWLECTIHASLPGGDHEIVLLDVLGCRVAAPDVRPLVFHDSTFHTLGAA